MIMLVIMVMVFMFMLMIVVMMMMVVMLVVVVLIVVMMVEAQTIGVVGMMIAIMFELVVVGGGCGRGECSGAKPKQGGGGEANYGCTKHLSFPTLRMLNGD